MYWIIHKWWWWWHSELYPCSLRGAVRIFGHCEDGDDEQDNGGDHTSDEILWREKEGRTSNFILYITTYCVFLSNLYDNCRVFYFISHRQRPEEAFKPLVELGGVGEQEEESFHEAQQGDCQIASCCRCRKTHKRYERKNLQRQWSRERGRDKWNMSCVSRQTSDTNV